MRVGVCIDIHFMILNLIIIAVSYEIRKLNNRHIFGLLTFNLFSSLSAAKLKWNIYILLNPTKHFVC